MIRKIHVFARSIKQLAGAPGQLIGVRAAVLSDSGLICNHWSAKEWAALVNSALVNSAPDGIEFTESPDPAPGWALQ